MTRQSMTPAAEPSAADALTATSTTALLTAAYALTHRIHECRGNQRAGECDGPCTDLRAQRDLIDAEVLRRTGEAPEPDVQVWGPREGNAGPVHRGLDGRGLYGQSWCGKRSQFRHRVYTAPADTVTCKTCLRRVASGSPLAYGAKS